MAQQAWYQLAKRDGFGFSNAKYTDMLLRPGSSNQAIHLGNEEDSSALIIRSKLVEANRPLVINQLVQSASSNTPLQLNSVYIMKSNIFFNEGIAASNLQTPLVLTDCLISSNIQALDVVIQQLTATNATVSNLSVPVQLTASQMDTPYLIASNILLTGVMDANKINIGSLDVEFLRVSNRIDTDDIHSSYTKTSNLYVTEFAEIPIMSNETLYSKAVYVANNVETEDLLVTNRIETPHLQVTCNVSTPVLHADTITNNSIQVDDRTTTLNLTAQDIATSNISTFTLTSTTHSNSSLMYGDQLFLAKSMTSPSISNLAMQTSVINANVRLVTPTISNQQMATSNLFVTARGSISNLHTSNALVLYGTVCNLLKVNELMQVENRLEASNIYVSELFSSNQVGSNITVTSRITSLLAYSSNIIVECNINVPWITNSQLDTSNIMVTSNIITPHIDVTSNIRTSNITVSNLYSSNQIGNTVFVNSNLVSLLINASNINVASNITVPSINGDYITASNLIMTSNISTPILQVSSNLMASNIAVSNIQNSNSTSIWSTVTDRLTASNISVSNLDVPIILNASNLNVSLLFGSNLHVTDRITASNATVCNLVASNITGACNINTPMLIGDTATFSNTVTSLNLYALIETHTPSLFASNLYVTSNIAACNLSACNMQVKYQFDTSNIATQCATISNELTVFKISASNMSLASNLTTPYITVSNLTGSQVNAQILNANQANTSNLTVVQVATTTRINASNIYSSNITSTVQMNASNIDTCNINTYGLTVYQINNCNIITSNIDVTTVTASSVTTPLIYCSSNIQASNASICNVAANIIYYYSGSNDYQTINETLTVKGVSSTSTSGYFLYAYSNIKAVDTYTSNLTVSSNAIIPMLHVEQVMASNISASNTIDAPSIVASNMTASNTISALQLIGSNITASNKLSSLTLFTSNATISNTVTTLSVMASNITATSNLVTPLINTSNLNSSNISVATSLAIGKSTASYPLDVQGDVNFSGLLYQGGQKYIGSQWTTSSESNSICITSCNVGINTSNPEFNLDVKGDVNFSGGLYQKGQKYIGSQWTTNSASNTISITSCNVGINTSNPEFDLDVKGNINFTGALYQKGQKYIGSQWTTNSASNAISITACNVGIGTVAPNTALDVMGAVTVSSNLVLKGTQSAPYISWADDLGTGIYHNSLGQVGIMCAGSNLLSSSNNIVNVNGNFTVNSKQVRTLDVDDSDAILVAPFPAISVLSNRASASSTPLFALALSVMTITDVKVAPSGAIYVAASCYYDSLPELYDAFGFKSSVTAPGFSTGNSDISVLIKYGPDGTPIWMAVLDGDGEDVLNNIAISPVDESIYVGGSYRTNLTYYTPSGTQILCTPPVNLDSFYLIKLNQFGGFQWVTYGTGYISAMVCDSLGAIWLSGIYYSDTSARYYDQSGAQYTTLPAGSGYGFAIKYSTTGAGAGSMSIAASVSIRDMQTDSSNSIYLYGDYTAPATFTINNSVTLSTTSSQTHFIIRANSSGICQWASTPFLSLPGTQYADISGIATDSAGNLYFTGIYASANTGFTLKNMTGTNSAISLPSTGASINYKNQYLIKTSSSGSVLWATYVTSESTVRDLAIATDSTGNAFICAASAPSIYDAGGTVSSISVPSSSSATIIKYNTSGVAQHATSFDNVSLVSNILIKDTNSGFYLITSPNENPPVIRNSANLTVALPGQVKNATNYIYKINDGFTLMTYRLAPLSSASNGTEKVLFNYDTRNSCNATIEISDTNGTINSLILATNQSKSYFWYNGCWLTASEFQAELSADNLRIRGSVFMGGSINVTKPIVFSGIMVQKRSSKDYYNITQSLAIDGVTKNSNGVLTLDMNCNEIVPQYEAADSIRFNNKHVELMRLTSTGKLGIGNANPLFPLDVQGDVNFTGTLFQNSKKYIGSRWTTNTASNKIYTLNCNVGIGVTDPQRALDVQGDINFSGLLYQGGQKYIGSQWTTNSASNAIAITGCNVGIGTSNATSPLTVAGDAAIAGSLNITNRINMNGILITKSTNAGTSTLTNNIEGYSKTSGNVTITADRSNVLQIMTGTFSNATFSNGDLSVAGIIKQSGSALSTLYPPSNHTHDAASAITGILPLARGGTGVGSLTTNKLVSSDGTVVNSIADLHWTGTQLGIGTTVPSARLTVVASASNLLYLENNTGGIGSCANIVFGTWVGASNAVIGVVDENFSAHIRFLTRQPGAATNAQVERMRITNDGKVGIGNNAPSAPLEVTGCISSIAPLSGTAFQGLNSSMAANGFTHIALGKTTSTLSNATVIKYTHVADGSANNSAQFGVWGATVITCLANGNVGIGTVTPTTALQVSGTVNATTLQQGGNEVITVAGGKTITGNLTVAGVLSGNGSGISNLNGSYITSAISASYLPAADTNQAGIVRLENTTNSSLTNRAATANAVRLAYERADSAINNASSAYDRASTGITNASTAQSTADAALPKAGGTITGALTVNGTLGTNNWTIGQIGVSFTDPGQKYGHLGFAYNGYLQYTMWYGRNNYGLFTGVHLSKWHETLFQMPDEYIGLIVVSLGIYDNVHTEELLMNQPTIDESLPVICLSSQSCQPACFGVISGQEDDGTLRYIPTGAGSAVVPKETTDRRIWVNSLGEGAIWVCDQNGNVKNGDYITTSDVFGYGMRQNDDVLHNYTVAKLTCSFSFDNPQPNIKMRYVLQDGSITSKDIPGAIRAAFLGCTYHCG